MAGSVTTDAAGSGRRSSTVARGCLSFVLASALASAGLLIVAEPASALTLTVTSSSDDGDGVCDDTCTLRDAMLAANVSPLEDIINFDIAPAGAHVIRPLSELPTMVGPVRINGRSQPGSTGGQDQQIRLDGSLAGDTADGLRLAGGDSWVETMMITGFGGTGLVLIGGGRNEISANRIGIDRAGQAGIGNTRGVDVVDSSENVISNNYIAGNTQEGIRIRTTSTLTEASDNQIWGNRIGDVDDRAVGNGTGVALYAGGNTVGRSRLFDANAIAGNSIGIDVRSAEPNTITSNYIGTAYGAGRGMGNGVGIFVSTPDVPNIIGGVDRGNIISGNTNQGIVLEGGSPLGSR